MVATPANGALTQAGVIRVLNENAAGATVVHAAGGIPGDIHRLWNSVEPNDYHSEYGYSCMGYEVAGALGVKLAEPQRHVLAFLGDGSWLMLHTELVTAVQEGIKLDVVLLDNHGYQCIHNLQRGTGGRSFHNEFRMRTQSPEGNALAGAPVPIDFVQNAASYGARTFTARTELELRAALREMKSEPRACFLYVVLAEPSQLPGTSWWDVPPAEVSSLPGVRAARAAYDEAGKKRRFFY
jgi:3D-(3,5/4)-trihydroxycyclohexane-1,2-dione acylhydrolase (decyclizing)